MGVKDFGSTALKGKRKYADPSSRQQALELLISAAAGIVKLPLPFDGFD